MVGYSPPAISDVRVMGKGSNVTVSEATGLGDKSGWVKFLTIKVKTKSWQSDILKFTLIRYARYSVDIYYSRVHGLRFGNLMRYNLDAGDVIGKIYCVELDSETSELYCNISNGSAITVGDMVNGGVAYDVIPNSINGLVPVSDDVINAMGSKRHSIQVY